MYFKFYLKEIGYACYLSKRSIILKETGWTNSFFLGFMSTSKNFSKEKSLKVLFEDLNDFLSSDRHRLSPRMLETKDHQRYSW